MGRRMVSLCVINAFFADPVAVLIEARRSLRPGGRLGMQTCAADGISVAAAFRLAARAEGIEVIDSNAPLGSEQRSRGVLAAAGFVDVQVVIDTWSEPLSDLADGWDVLLHGLLSGPIASKPANVHQAQRFMGLSRPRHPAMIRPFRDCRAAFKGCHIARGS